MTTNSVEKWFNSAASSAQQYGAGKVLIAWGLGVVLLILVSWLGRRLIRALSNASTLGEAHAI